MLTFFLLTSQCLCGKIYLYIAWSTVVLPCPCPCCHDIINKMGLLSLLYVSSTHFLVHLLQHLQKHFPSEATLVMLRNTRGQSGPFQQVAATPAMTPYRNWILQHHHSRECTSPANICWHRSMHCENGKGFTDNMWLPEEKQPKTGRIIINQVW